MSFLTRIRRWIRGSAANLDPHESDVRAVAPEDRPVVEQFSQDTKDVGKEHRG